MDLRKVQLSKICTWEPHFQDRSRPPFRSAGQKQSTLLVRGTVSGEYLVYDDADDVGIIYFKSSVWVDRSSGDIGDRKAYTVGYNEEARSKHLLLPLTLVKRRREISGGKEKKIKEKINYLEKHT